jgi:hypothetical protein
MMSDSIVKLPTLAEYRLSPESYTDPRAVFEGGSPQLHKPNHAWIDLNCKSIQTSLKGIRFKAEKILANAASTDIEIQEYRALLQKIEHVPQPVQTNIVIVGQQGKGKSSVTNALLNRYNLAEISGMGNSCSKYATKYTYLSGASPKCSYSHATVEFLDEVTIKNMLEKLIADYEYVHFNKAKDEAVSDDRKILANSAIEVFSVAFDTKNDTESRKQLDCLLTKLSIESGEMLQVTLAKVLQRIRSFGADSNHIKVLEKVLDRDLPEAREKLDALWPFVELFTIARGDLLLRHRVSLFDVPGMSILERSGYGSY